VIGQACEFDYSGSQAVKALKEEGYRVILHNSNPATIMTDPEMADATYLEPLTVEYAEEIIARERPSAILPTLGGQTALNLAFLLEKKGVLAKYGVKLIGANAEAIEKAEDRHLFKKTMEEIGLKVLRSVVVHTVEEAVQLWRDFSYPVILRPAFTLGGTGGGVAYNREELEEKVKYALELSPIREVLLEESVLGWKEYELEVMRDLKDQVVIICSIENLDPMGVHTGDSITVAPAQTLTDKEYQRMRDAAIRIIRAIGVETGGSNIQFAVHPKTGEMVVIEMNPRVSRSSALASKATGFPIARIAAKLAIGYTLDELKNEITQKTPASFEPSIDYVVTKIPRFAFEKFPSTPDELTTSMRSVGEVMAIGRSLEESLQKAIAGLESSEDGFSSLFGWDRRYPPSLSEEVREKLIRLLSLPNSRRLFAIGDAFRAGMGVEEIASLTSIDPWFLEKIKKIISFEREWLSFFGDKEGGPSGEREFSLLVEGSRKEELLELLREGKRLGFSDSRLAYLWNLPTETIEGLRKKLGVLPTYKTVDTCAGEFASRTPYVYSTYETYPEVEPLPGEKVVVVGGGPNRIGQGIEFDYCCVHAVQSLREMGFSALMINSNPETVSTDYDLPDRLYFESITEERVAEIVEFEKAKGVLLQFGGQTPLKISKGLEKRGIPVLGTSPEAIDIAEDRDRFQALVDSLGFLQPPHGVARNVKEARRVAEEIGFPLLVRPSYVLGGRAMEIVYGEEDLERYVERALQVYPKSPLLMDRFLEDALEFDIDAISDGERVWVGGVLQHIEYAGVHSGDSASILPPLRDEVQGEWVETMIYQVKAFAKALKIVGLLNLQVAVKDGEVYILEVNPRASRTVPFISKSVGVPMAKLATRLALGKEIPWEELPDFRRLPYYAVKEVVLPFDRFPGEDALLGPEMKSTGEVMGIDPDPALAYAKAQISAGTYLPSGGTVLVSVSDRDKPRIVPLVEILLECGYRVVATKGTRDYLLSSGIEVDLARKVTEGRPHIVDMLKNSQIQMVINTPIGRRAAKDSQYIRRSAIEHRIPYFTTVEGAKMAVLALKAMGKKKPTVLSLQEWHRKFRELRWEHACTERAV
jgi:carbamoyl-phosphate synthase large subunit